MYFIVLTLYLFTFANSEPNSPKLLVVSFGGFRKDYLDLGLTPTLNSLKASSTHARSLIPVFPTQKFPNLWTIATGVYPDKHCVLGSRVYDESRKKLLKDEYDLYHHNKNQIPIWLENETRGGGYSGIMMWPGAEHVESLNLNPTFKVLPGSDSSMGWKKRVDQILRWFKHETTPTNLVMAHFEHPKEMNPSFKADQIPEFVKRVDATVKYLLTKMDQLHLSSEVNLVFLSDHGTLDVPAEKVINLADIVDKMAKIYGESPVLQVYPEESGDIDLEQVVYQILMRKSTQDGSFKVYLKEQIPVHFHMKECELSPPILLVAEPPYTFQDVLVNTRKCGNNEMDPAECVLAVSGYDPRKEAMHTFFIAHGPLFRKNHLVSELHSIDMFLLFSHILGLDVHSLPQDGFLDRVKDILRTAEPKEAPCDQYSILSLKRYSCFTKAGINAVVSFVSSIFCLQ